MTNVDEAWTAFKNQGTSIAKASVNEKLDVLAAQLNEVQTDTKRLAQIVPKIMGDESAIDSANESAMDPMAAMMGGGAPPMGGDMGGGEMPPEGEEGEEMPENEEMPLEDTPLGGSEEGGEMPPEESGELPPEEPVPEEGGDLGEDVGGDIGMEEPAPEMDADVEMEGDNDAVSILRDALQEAMDSDQMDLVSKISAAIAKLQNSSANGSELLSGGDDAELADLLGDETGGASEAPVEEPPAEEPPAESKESSSDSEDSSGEKTEHSEKSAIAKTGEQGNMSTGSGDMDPTEQVAASGTNDIKAEVMEAVADALDETLGTDDEVPADDEDEDEDEDDEYDDDDEDEKDYEEDEEEEPNEELAEHPFEECDTMRKSMQFAEHMSFRDLLSVKKSKQFGIDGRPAKGMFQKMDPSSSLLDSQTPDIAMSEGDDVGEATDVEEIPLEDVESAKAETEAPDALEPGVRTEVAEAEAPSADVDVAETDVDEVTGDTNETAPDQIDDVGTPMNASNEDSGLGPITDENGDILEEEEKSAIEKTNYGHDKPDEYAEPKTVKDAVKNHDKLTDSNKGIHEGTVMLADANGGRPTDATESSIGHRSGPSDKHLEKSATLDELGKPCEDLKSGKSSKPADMLDDVGEKKSPSGSAEPKPTIADDVGEKKGKGTAENPGDLLDDIDAKKGEGSAKNVPDMIDDVGHEKKATEHTVRPGTGLLDDVKEVKKSVQEENGKHIMSMKELMSVRKSGQRPDSVTSTSGDLVRPELGNPIRKTATGTPVRMGHGVDPHKVTENDWAEYKIYKAQREL